MAAAKAAAARLHVELIKAELAAAEAEAEAEAAEQSPPPPPPGPLPTAFRGAGFNPVIPKPAVAPPPKDFLKNRAAVVHAIEKEAGEDTAKSAAT
ncbi:MAG: hypothetical protein ACKPKO_48050 [Candidatus Fonsibacter sp.]